ncbi:MAG: thiamine ABC transporter substrate-binding protein [Candidatus Thorarchaeota archaeon]|nr:thiamine ABC transporter substrate-binding protein [Candidatus Thorarchaeota archaeon]
MATNQYPTRRNPKTLIIAVAIVIIIVVASYGILTWRKPTFTVYTYDSFMLWGNDPDDIDETVFGAFEEQYGIDINIVRLQTDANGIVSRLVAEAENPVADVVIGIDNILILQSLAKSVLEPYIPANIDLINDSIVSALDSEHYVAPFDFGLITVIYKPSVVNTTSHPSLDNLTLQNLSSLSPMLVTENPHFSSPGLAFLLSQITISEKLMHEDWTDWWQNVKDDIDVQEGWTEAWTKWDSDPTRHLLVSYGTDPAYSSYYIQGEPDTAIAPLKYGGVDYAWMQVEGIGLVKDGPNPDIGKLFIDYCLSSFVQSHIALNQWMFPANFDVTFDPAFQYALHPNDVNLLNPLLPASEIAANLNTWLDDYDEIMTG